MLLVVCLLNEVASKMPVHNAQLEVLGSNPEVTDWLEEERN